MVPRDRENDPRTPENLDERGTKGIPSPREGSPHGFHGSVTLHPEAPRKGLGTWLTMAAGAVAAAILVWGAVEIARARIDSGPVATGTDAPADTLRAAPPGTRLYSEVFSVSDAVLHRGTWFVLDRRGAQVHRIDESGALLGSFGRRGEGPGEFRRPEAIASRGDSVIVLDGGELHLFDLGGSPLANRTVELEGCATGAARDLLVQPTGLLLLVGCREAGRMAWMVVLETGDGSYRTLAARGTDPGVVDLGMAYAVLGAHARGFAFGLPQNDCLDIFGPQGAELGTVCHDWIERLPVPKELEDGMASVRERARVRGVRLVEPNRLPPFTQVMLVGGELAYQVPLPDDLDAFRLVRRGPTGEAVAFPLPAAEGLFAGDNSVLLWWEGVDGMLIAIRNAGVS